MLWTDYLDYLGTGVCVEFVVGMLVAMGLVLWH